MPTLFDGMRSAVNALHAAGEAMAVTQINMTNASVPGYAKQNVNLTADGFDFSRGLAGGSKASSSSARSLYAEQAVWAQASQEGTFDSFTQSASGVDAILGATDSTGKSGLQGALGGLFQSFNQLRQGSTDLSNQQNVVQSANAFALTVSQTADFLGQSGAMAQSRIQTTVDQINGIVKGIQQWNTQASAGNEGDPVSEAKVYASLEKLSSLVPITVQKDPNGSMTILMNGQTPLLQGSVVSPISISFVPPAASAAFPNAPAALHIVNAQGEDITESAQTGELGGLLKYVNEFLPSLMGDGNQQGDLNRMAESMAQAVNSAIGGSKPLFVFDTNPTNVARSLQLNPTFSNADLVAAVAASPAVLSNLTELASGTTAATQIDGQSYSSFFVALTTRTSMEVSAAQNSQALQNGLTEQARSFREAVQGATVEESAVALLEYQRAFQAAAKVISTIDELTKMTIDLIR